MLIFLDWIYKDCKLCLKRKFDRYIGLKNIKVRKYERRKNIYKSFDNQTKLN